MYLHLFAPVGVHSTTSACGAETCTTLNVGRSRIRRILLARSAVDGVQGDVQRRAARLHARQLQLDRLHRPVRLPVVVRAPHPRPAAHPHRRPPLQRHGDAAHISEITERRRPSRHTQTDYGSSFMPDTNALPNQPSRPLVASAGGEDLVVRLQQRDPEHRETVVYGILFNYLHISSR